MLKTADINAALKDCPNLGSALTLLSSIGVDTGTVRIAGDDLRGWIVFKNKKVVQAVVAETAQVGQAALAALAELDDAKCTYLAAPGAPQSQSAAPPGAGNDPQKISQKLPQAPPKAQSLMNEDDFRSGVFGRDVNSEFLHQDPRMSVDDAPIRRNIVFKRLDAVEDEVEQVEHLLATAGFTSDFVDVTPAAKDPWSDFHGDPQNQKAAVYERPKTAPSPVKMLVGIWFFAMCLSIYIAPKLIWDRADKQAKDDLERRHKQMIAQALQDENVLPIDRPFNFGNNAANAVANAGTGSFNASYTSDSDAFPPDLPPDTPENLNALIRWYLRHGNFKKAKELAQLAMNMPNINPGERSMFMRYYNSCLADNAIHMDMSAPAPIDPRRANLRPLTAAEKAKSEALILNKFSIDMKKRPPTGPEPKKAAPQAVPSKAMPVPAKQAPR